MMWVVAPVLAALVGWCVLEVFHYTPGGVVFAALGFSATLAGWLPRK